MFLLKKNRKTLLMWFIYKNFSPVNKNKEWKKKKRHTIIQIVFRFLESFGLLIIQYVPYGVPCAG
jgi:hypothetical protein